MPPNNSNFSKPPPTQIAATDHEHSDENTERLHEFVALHRVENLPLNTLPWDAAPSDSLIDPSNTTEKEEFTIFICVVVRHGVATALSCL